ncbi:plasmid mobilization protein [Gloeothece verrucosa]|uniref:Mobilization protein n=1 Tax=Gloeothece verrucosa (strain PCC 7822) TaxID=497965 RepID=E0UNV4_GLOV7|nr:hypothetical protein [Gloeothece verrucosa]ADN18634.1 hypothetical protein Cyan7822_6689 [Gloeothece verrucosa PCC 7822]
MPKRRQSEPSTDSESRKKSKRDVEYKIRLRADERIEWEAKARALRMNLAAFIRRSVNRRRVARVPAVNIETNRQLTRIGDLLTQHITVVQTALSKGQPVNIDLNVLEELAATIKQTRREVLGIDTVESEEDLT